jgi:DNA-binding transcriptional regulator YiaG
MSMDEFDRRSLIPHHVENLMGIPLVLINGAYWTTHEGERFVAIPDQEGLEAAAAVARATLPDKLGGDEIRFMRRALRMKASDLAKRLDVAPETFSRWENGWDAITRNPERILRLRVVHALRSRAPGVQADDGMILDMAIPPLRLVGSPPALIFERRAMLRPNGGEEEVWFFRGREEMPENRMSKIA